MRVPCLTIAGSDSSGGAGIQADLKTFLANGVYGMSVITSITAQNTLGVQKIFDLPPDMVGAQLDSIFTDLPPKGIKIGMVSSPELVHVIAEKLEQYQGKNIVIDPVMGSTTGTELTAKSGIRALQEELFPMATLITPNLDDAEALTGRTIVTESEMEVAAEELYLRYGCCVLIKGGHLTHDANDYLYDGAGHWFCAKRIENKNTHGTGCTLSSAIAAGLAKGEALPGAVKSAKSYMNELLSTSLDLGEGSGPLDHGYPLLK